MRPPEKRRGDPRQGRPSIAASINGTPRNSISLAETPDLAELVRDALAAGLLFAGGRFQLRHGRLVPEARP